MQLGLIAQPVQSSGKLHLRVLSLKCLPELSWLSGRVPTQDARCLADTKDADDPRKWPSQGISDAFVEYLVQADIPRIQA